MSTAVAEVTEIEALLAPIPGENPTGENLQYSGLHDEIREARRSEEALEQGEWKRELKSADWHQVESLATEALATRSKDLQVCVWLTEALVKLHGLTGLRDALKLTRGLLEQFWDNLYPEIDEGDLEARANALSWLDRQLAIAVKEVPVTKTSTGVNYSFLQWEDSKQFDVPEKLDDLGSEELQRISELKERAAREGRITSEQWRIAKNTTRRAFYEELYMLLNGCWEDFKALDRVMDEKFQRQTPGLGELKKSLDDIRTQIEKLVKEKRITEPDTVEAEEGTAAEEALSETEGGPAVSRAVGPVRTREDALKRLTEVANYFHKTEPHSPVSYLVERAIKWGQMPLAAWLEDVVKNDAVLDQLRETLGLKVTSASSEKED